MPEESQLGKLLYERLRNLPQKLQGAILRIDVSNKVRMIINKNNLPQSAFFPLENETTLLILGVRTPDEFEEEIAKKTGLGKVVLDKVIDDINEMIFEPLMKDGDLSTPEVENYRSILKDLKKKSDV